MELFKLAPETAITAEVVQEFIKRHKERLPRYKRLGDLYTGNHPILAEDEKSDYKPDNRLVANHAKYITDTYNGFFISIPVKVTSDDAETDDFIQAFRQRNFSADQEAELSKLASIYGHGYEYIYQDEESETCTIVINPKNAFIVYDTSIKHDPVFGVYYGEDGGLLCTDTVIQEFNIDDDEVVFAEEEQEHHYGGVPIIEYIENEERIGTFETAETLINAFNKALSEKKNDVDYFSDAYLTILGAELDETTIKQLRDNRIINLFGQGTEKVIVEFLEKPSADDTQEHLLDRLSDLIYQMAMVANISDEAFGHASGISLEYKLLPMRNLALTKERKFSAAMQRKYKMVFKLPTNGSNPNIWQQLKYTFTQNIPEDIKSEAETAQILQGIVSDETMLSTLSFVDNPKDEIDRRTNERELTTYDIS